VDRFCDEVRAKLLAGLPDRERFAVELLLREALNNAIVHGCLGKIGSEVHCELAAVDGGVRIRVRDPGDGFDWRAQLNGRPRSLAESGRGVEILTRYATTVAFSEKGNEVEMIRSFDQGTRL
jgi:anti-sigma regulatory factor (Ser/Thr protein kinase)